MASKTLSIRIDNNAYKSLSLIAREEKEDVSKTVRELVDLGRLMLAIEKYKKSEASIEKASHIAGISISKMMELLKEYGVEANLEYEDYIRSLKTVRKIW